MIIVGSSAMLCHADQDIVFNTDVLDIHDRDNVDLTQFSRVGYIMPGRYSMMVILNKTTLSEYEIEFANSALDPKQSIACLPTTLVPHLGLKPEIIKSLKWRDDGRCVDEQSLAGLQARGNLSTSTLNISIPQAYFEYSSAYWDPPSRWDEGISGFIFDYNLNSQIQKNQNANTDTDYKLNALGTLGVNLKNWRVRADWHSKYSREVQQNERRFEWNRYYAYSAIPQLRAKLTLGDDYLDSGIFEGFRFIGLSLKSDDTMLAPNIRGYAPEIRGNVNSHALVTVSQQGRVIYETQVAAGPFRIQDLNDAVTGELDVLIEEQDGRVQQFTVNTASIPYLTRPGLVRYKLSAGQPKHSETERDFNFAAGEFSWGINNGWSLYGGLVAAEHYQSAALGVGRDLLAFGAISADITQSWGHFSDRPDLKGNSFRLSYSKKFDQYDSQITFAGYRFSQENFLSPSEYLNLAPDQQLSNKNKEMYTISLNKHFRDSGLSWYFNYSRQSYWNQKTNNRYDLTLSRYFNFGRLNNLNLSLSAFRYINNQVQDDGATLSVSIPWKKSTLSYYGSAMNDRQSHSMGYFNRLSPQSIYSLNAGSSDSDLHVSGYFSHESNSSKLSVNANYRENNALALGLNLQGGLTLSPEGGALHRVNTPGGTRVLLDTQGVANIPIRGYGNASHSNQFGKSVITDINSYYRTQLSVDLNRLDDDAEVMQSITQATLTEGAIGYRQFDVVSGAKAMATIQLAKQQFPPFGAIVLNQKRQQVGLIADQGQVLLSGVSANAQMSVQWAGKTQCKFQLPQRIADDMLMNSLNLNCEAIAVVEDE